MKCLYRPYDAHVVLSVLCGRSQCDVRTSDQRLVDSKERGDQLAAPLPFQDFMEISVTSEGSQSRRASHYSRKLHAVPQNILEGEKYHAGQTTSRNNMKKRVALFMSAPPPLVFQGFTKSTCCFVLLMICLPLFQSSATLFVCESSLVQWRLHTEPKMHDVSANVF